MNYNRDPVTGYSTPNLTKQQKRKEQDDRNTKHKQH